MGFKMRVTSDEDPCISDDVTFANAVQLPDGSWVSPFVLIDEESYRDMAIKNAPELNLFVCSCDKCQEKARVVSRESRPEADDGNLDG